MASSRWSSRAKAVWASFSPNCTVVDIKPIAAGAATLWRSERKQALAPLVSYKPSSCSCHWVAVYKWLILSSLCTKTDLTEINRWLTKVSYVQYLIIILFCRSSSVLKQRKAGSTTWWQCHNVGVKYMGGQQFVMYSSLCSVGLERSDRTVTYNRK